MVLNPRLIPLERTEPAAARQARRTPLRHLPITLLIGLLVIAALAPLGR